MARRFLSILLYSFFSKKWFWRVVLFSNLIYHFALTHLLIFGRKKIALWSVGNGRRWDERGGGAAIAPPIDRPLPPNLPGLVPDDETWKLENVSCISCWRECLATWSSEIELVLSGLREKIRSVLKIHRRTKHHYCKEVLVC